LFLRKVKTMMISLKIHYNLKECYDYLFSASLYELIFVLNKDALLHYPYFTLAKFIKRLVTVTTVLTLATLGA
jgi:hypothetical protein